MRNKLAYLHFFVIALFLLAGCNAGKRALVKGFNSFESGDYNVAIDHYKVAIDNGMETTLSNYKIAEAYRLSNRLQEALPYYEAAIESGIPDTSAVFHYAMSLKQNGEYDQAKEELQEYIELSEDTVLEYTAWARQELDNLDRLGNILSKDVYYEIKNEEYLNTEGAEYAPTVHRGTFYFTTSRNSEKVYKATGTGFTNIMQAPIENGLIKIEDAHTLGEEFADEIINEGAITFSPDGRTMVFARGNSGKRKGTRDVNLYISRYQRGEWTTPEIMTISDPDAWDSTPAFSRDGNTLYFSSNRPGGYGGNDLYSARVDNRGRWSSVRNMGEVINTPGHEMFPYVTDDGKLYFSSDGHPSMGALDIFVAIRKDGQITIENLGPPVNSTADDFGMTFTSIKDGYFTSNRAEGKGDDDIYAFVNNDPELKTVNYFLAGITVTEEEDSGEEKKLEDVKVSLAFPEGSAIESQNSGEEGAFKFAVQGGTNYELVGEKEGYFTTRVPFSTVGKTIPQEELVEMVTDTTFTTKLVLNKIVLDKAIVLENIYYEFDESFITDAAAVELDKLVKILEDNPQISIELSSHTDSRGDNEYNQELSQRRAESAVQYLVDSGINPERITARGYGEEQLIIKNAMTEEQHEINRRTEFKVTRVDNSRADASE
ncbi:OmpA family protein [Catalinimonas sp. 4WD22]|uniref:OmpA family protein n=1 Tax=Catalinimonas locisalis TaxID=3133978 RepID=UPI0031013484